MGDVDKLLKDVSLTLKKCQTPTKSISSIISSQPTMEQLQAAIEQLKELLKQSAGVVLLDIGPVDHFKHSEVPYSQSLST